MAHSGEPASGTDARSRQLPDRHTPLPAGSTKCTLLLSDPTQVPFRKAERSFAAPSSSALSGGQGLGVVCLLPDPTCARRGHCALTRDDQGWPSRSRLPRGTQLPKSPLDRLSPPSLARSPPGGPRKHKLSRGNGAGRGRGLPEGLGGGKVAAQKANDWESAGERARLLPQLRALGASAASCSQGRRPRSPPRPGMRSPARPHAHPGARGSAPAGRRGTRGLGRSRMPSRLLPGGFESQQLVTVVSPFSTALSPTRGHVKEAEAPETGAGAGLVPACWREKP